MIRVLLLLAALLSALPARAGPTYSSLYVFGDSLSDNGNAFTLSGGAWPPSPPYTQQFSNGPVAAQRLAADLGVPLARSTQGGTDYAIGGATTGSANYNFEVQSPPLPSTLEKTGVLAQVGSFIAAKPAFDPNHTLFMVWAGPNDFFLALDRKTGIPGALASAVNNLVTAIGELAGIGARHVLLPNMPNLADIPFGQAQAPADRAALDALSLAFNGALVQAASRFDSIPGFSLTAFDTASLLHQVVTNPGEFGFSNATGTCFLLGSCQGYVFFDEVHPTATTHALLGDRFFAALQVPEPSTGALLAVALLALWASFPRSPARILSAASPAARSTA